MHELLLLLYRMDANGPPEDWCSPICGQHEINGPVRLRFVWIWQGADCTPHLAWLHQIKPPCHIDEVDNLLFWNTLLNQSSDQHVLLFMYTKEEESFFCHFSLIARSGKVTSLSVW